MDVFNGGANQQQQQQYSTQADDGGHHFTRVQVLQQSLHLAMTSADPQIVAEAWVHINAAKEETARTRAEAAHIVDRTTQDAQTLVAVAQQKADAAAAASQQTALEA